MSRSVEQLCRVCMRKCKSRNVSLWDTFPMEKDEHYVTSYLSAYRDCTQLSAQPGADGLPERLCASCSHDLQISYKFCCRARDADAKLRSELEASMQQQEQHQEQGGAEAKRAATPSEFELPALNGADGYLKFGAGDACILNEASYAKDPLEDTDSEDEAKFLSGLAEKQGCISPTAAVSTGSYDSDDDKPLKELMLSAKDIDAKQFESKPVLPKAEEFDNFKTPKMKELNANEVTINQDFYDDDDEFIVADEYINGKINDTVFSPEAQIFPKGRFKCEICLKTYFTTVGLKAHLEVHLPKSAIAKKKRVRKKQSKPSLQNETASLSEESASVAMPTLITDVPKAETKLRKKQQPKPKKMFPCHVCGKHMISASKLRYHMVMHTGEKDYLCTMCPKAYSTIYALKHHIRTHTGERPYECKFCGDKFLRPTTLKSHQRRHTGERPYGCDVCGKRFIQHSSMTTHMRLNHMEKTIKCPYCDKKYARQTDLNTHLLSHTGDKPYPCQLCPSRFVRQANLNKHMNQQHSGKGTGGTSTATVSAKRVNTKVCLNDAMEVAKAFENEIGSTEDTATASMLSDADRNSAHIKSELNADLNAEFNSISRIDNTVILSDLEQPKNALVMYNLNIEEKLLPTQDMPLEAMCTGNDLARWHWPDN